MKLPLSAVRATLKLQNPAQRLFWALSQYEAGLAPSPVVAANPANGIPATPASAGINAPLVKTYPDTSLLDFDFLERTKLYEFRIDILVNNALVARGIAIEKCLQETSSYIIQPFAGIVPAELPDAVDESTATTLEQYIYEQWLALKADRDANPVTISGANFVPHSSTQIVRAWNSASFASVHTSRISLTGNILKKQTLGNLNTVQFTRRPWDCVDFAGYAAS